MAGNLFNFNGDGKTDLIDRIKENGHWWVSVANPAGTGFLPPTLWAVIDPWITWAQHHSGERGPDLGRRLRLRGALCHMHWHIGTTPVPRPQAPPSASLPAGCAHGPLCQAYSSWTSCGFHSTGRGVPQTME